MMWWSFQLGMARGVPVTRILLVPSGQTETPSSILFSSSSASLLHISAQRTGSSKKAICIIRRASLPLIGDLRAFLQLNTLPRAFLLLFTILIASLRFSTVILFPVKSSTTFLNSSISPAHFTMSFSRFI